MELTDVYAATNTTVQVSLAGLNLTADGCGCDEPTNAPAGVANLKLRKEYQMTVIASNLQCATLALKLEPYFPPLAPSGKQSLPKEYLLLVDRTPAPYLTEQTFYLSAGCDYCSNAWTIEVRDEKLYHWYTDDGSDDPGPAPGDGFTVSMGPGNSCYSNQVALDWSVSLGRLFDGTAAGRLRVRENGLSRPIYTPTNLYYTASSTNARAQVELVCSSADGVLRQVRSYQTLVDIVEQANETQIRFYFPGQVATNKDEQGIYTNISGSPFVIWTLRNPEPATTNQLHVIETRNGLSRTNRLAHNPFSATETWQVRYGVGAEEQVETRGIVFHYSPHTSRVETVTIKYASSNTPAYKCIETYRLFEWGWELVELRADPDNANLVTSFTFNDNAADPWTFRRRNTVVYPDGYWEKYVYWAGALDYILRPATNGPADPESATVYDSHAVRYDYHPFSGRVYTLSHYCGGLEDENQFRYQWINCEKTGCFVTSFEGDYLKDDHSIALGIEALTMDESWGNGLSFHPLHYYDGRGAALVMYYHGGTYDPFSGSFATNGLTPGDGPDWRQSVIYYGYYGHPLHLEPNEYPPIEVVRVEGEPLWSMPYYDGVLLAPYVSHRESRIFQDGSLVQRELAVFTGLDEQNEAVFEPYQRIVYQNDSLGHPTNVVLYDEGSVLGGRVIYQADYRGGGAFDGDLLLWEADDTGIRTEYQYDSLKRLCRAIKKGLPAAGGFPAQADVVTATRYDAAGRVVEQSTTSGGLGLTNHWTFDMAGRLTGATDEKGLATKILYELGGRLKTITLPSGATDIQENYLDRRLHTRTGSAVVHEHHDYWVVADPRLPRVTVLEEVRYGSGWARWGRIGTDWFCLPAFWESPDYPGTNSVAEWHVHDRYLHHPQVIERPGMERSLFVFDYDGAIGKTVVGPAAYGANLASLSRISRTLRQFVKEGNSWFKVETNYVYLTDGDATPTIGGRSRERLSGFASPNTVSEVTTWDADKNATVSTVYVDQTAKKITEVLDTAQSTLNATNVVVNGLLQAASTTTVATPTRFYYDALGRQTGVVSPLGFAAATTYNALGQVASVTDFTGARTSYEYYPNGVPGAGQIKSETRSDGKKTYYKYTLRGELCQKWGDVPYPEERVYNEFGDLVELRTFRNGTGWSASDWPTNTCGSFDKTTWVYDAPSGLLIAKLDHQNLGPSYTYTNGMLFTRSWARSIGGERITSTNTYNSFGDLAQIDYNDGTPSVQLLDYNRGGQPRSIIDATGTNNLFFDHAMRLTLATNIDGLLAGTAVSNRFNGLYGRDRLSVHTPAGQLLEHLFGYDTCGRMGSVGSGTHSATYAYTPSSDLLATTTFKRNGAHVMTTTRSWEYGVRLGAIVNQVANANLSSHSYLYDQVNRRTQAVMEDGSMWKYEYNSRDELISGKHFWPDWAPFAGQQFGYAYDNIGNCRAAWSGGDSNGSNLRQTGYLVNELNQYTMVTNLGFRDILGAAYATDAVLITNSITGVWQTAERKGEYFRGELSINNAAGPLWQTLGIGAGGSVSNGGFVFPKNEQALIHDADGNLVYDGAWTYEWDAENRLKRMAMTNITGIPNAQRKRMDFAYDFQGRRFMKAVSTWTGSAFAGPVTNLFIYDGWNLLATLNPQLSPVNSFMWGQDLSGTMDQAGGVGGLLMVVFHGTGTTNCFVAYDGNGNVTTLVNASTGGIEARYEYSPFGETIRETGLLARNNPFRWSSKFCDQENGLVYYGARYYLPTLGRWIGRDPAEEHGGLNLLGFVLNNPACAIDTLGEAAIWVTEDLRIDADPRRLTHVHDYLENVSFAYGVDANGNPQLTPLKGHEKEFDLLRAQKSLGRVLQTREGLQAMKSANSSLWSKATNATRQTLRATGRAIKVAGRAAGVASAFFAIMAAAEGAQQISIALDSYAKNAAAGESTWADLDAIEVAVGVQMMTGNYFVTMDVLGIMLQ
ncbi:MAG TPA: RHS repeat-associated core domain-containing protein [Verrucomicrobiota bacterium]|nr:RHS repeat-associated core domain-containing protein [Verrucomicrobiota bacterium]HRT57162.1 RHS repeat-associated core domain-containing protein [Candidatus Paceibacterota bacterium]